MTANYWTSTQAQRWIFTRMQLLLSREEDLRYASPEEVGAIGIWCANAVSLLCKRLQLRQRVSATATVFLKRFYIKNSYCNTDPCLVITSCVYVAAKAEESPVHIRSVAAEAVRVWSEMGNRTFGSSSSVLAEMEFYLLEELEFDLIVHHPYRTLVQIANTMGRVGNSARTADEHVASGEKRKRGKEQEADEHERSHPLSATDRELGLTDSKRSRAAGSEDATLEELDDAVMQLAWFVLNDTYRSDIPLLYPPHLIAIASVFLALVLHPPSCEKMETSCNNMQDAREKWEQKVTEGEKARFEAAQEAAAAAAAAAATANTTTAQQEASTVPPHTPLAGLGIDSGRKASGTGSLSAAMTPTGSATGWNAYAGSSNSLATTPAATTPAAGVNSSSTGTGTGTGAGASAGNYFAQHLSSNKPPAPLADTLTVFASMNVSLPLLAEVVNEMLASYELWHLVGSNPSATSSSSKDKEKDTVASNESSAQVTVGAFLDLQMGSAPERAVPRDLVGDGAAMLKLLDRMREARRQELLRRKKS